ncbi:MAG TPA: type VI secretion system baseplate subunit TssF, partial [Planctomycetota bacterium]|nr:type VI secretion system baseplate subunit TssF [Planctomycetota bacterium]
MDPRLLRYYKDELEFVREMAAEFAAEYPKIAGRLGLNGLEVADPYVERLLEGFAFLTARVQLKIDAEFPRFTAALLECLFPNYLAPVPSMAMLQFTPNAAEPALVAGFELPRGTVARGLLGKGDQTTCEYRTAQSLLLWPIELLQAQYIGSPRDLAAFQLPDLPEVRAGVRLRLGTTGKATWGQLPIRSLPLFLLGPEDLPMHLYEQLLGNTIAVIVRPVAQPVPWQERLPATAVMPVGFADAEALLPLAPRAFQGHRLLLEYFTFPERFRSINLTGLDRVTARLGSARELEVFFLLDRAQQRLENNVDASRFALFCAPAINLFPKSCARIHLDPTEHEYHIVPDRSRPLDFEVHSLLEVVGHGTADEEQQLFRPLYGTDDFALPGADLRHYTQERRPRVLSEPQRPGGQRSSYPGSETFIALVDGMAPP